MDVLGVLVGTCEDEGDSKRICDLFTECPYNILNKSEDRFIILVFSIPEDHTWWLEEIKENPENTLGLKEADVFFSDEFGDLPDMEFGKCLEQAPCGTDCENCGFYPERCRGCPSTVYYMGE